MTEDFFPKIGQAADTTDAFEDDERAVQEIESLCMECHENVCLPLLLSFNALLSGIRGLPSCY
jgi:hypothetical protein